MKRYARNKTISRAIVLLGFLAILCSCKTVKKSSERFSIDKEIYGIKRNSIVFDSVLINSKLKIVIYDTDKPKDPETGKHPVKAEIEHEKDIVDVNKEIQNDTVSEVKEHEDHMKKEKEITPAPSNSFFSGVKFGVIAVFIMLAVLMIKRKK